MISNPKDIILVDFDGTLLVGNSFHLWLRHIVATGVSGAPFLKRTECKITTLMCSTLRFFNVISHERLKRSIQRAWGKAIRSSSDPEADLMDFLHQLQGKIDPNLLAEVKNAQMPDVKVILVTAAAGEYAVPIGEILGFDDVLATPCITQESWFHNIGGVKLQKTMEYLESKGWNSARLVLYTDHIDDLPLMDAVDEVHIVTDNENNGDALEKSISGRAVVHRYLRKTPV